jgi:hypothetical protein
LALPACRERQADSTEQSNLTNEDFTSLSPALNLGAGQVSINLAVCQIALASGISEQYVKSESLRGSFF